MVAGRYKKKKKKLRTKKHCENQKKRQDANEMNKKRVSANQSTAL